MRTSISLLAALAVAGFATAGAQNTGGAGGFHLGMQTAHERGFDRIWLMDDDVVPAPECLGVLMATDEAGIAHSLDSLSASLNEANRWLRDQRELFAGLDTFTDEPPPADLLASKRSTRRTRVSE